MAKVASVLMHAWSEVEHDLVYKPMQGTLSEEELAILDELNGLVLTGEIALERLQAAGNERIQNSKATFARNIFKLLKKRNSSSIFPIRSLISDLS